MQTLGRYSLGIGDRFGRQGQAQLSALQTAHEAGVSVTPVWNKSHREHSIVGSRPADVRQEADAAVQALDWKEPYFVDADHIGPGTVGAYLKASDFFTLDVADTIGKPAPVAEVEDFVDRHRDLIGSLSVPGLSDPLVIQLEDLRSVGHGFLRAVNAARETYALIESAKGRGNFITEVSMDETERPQSPLEMLLILAALADKGIPVNTIAPKFSGRFNKGVDYVGDPAEFEREFEQDVCVAAYAVTRFGLPEGLKLSVHSGSDKFSLYGPIHRVLKTHSAGVHLKTAGTTWLEELIGLAESGGEGLALAQEIYAAAWERLEELCTPYATVISVDQSHLPVPATVRGWAPTDFAAALRHDQQDLFFNSDLRQFLHVAYKVAAEFGDRYYQALDTHTTTITECVRENLYERHIRPLFMGQADR